MGWGSGVYVFDDIVGAILDEKISDQSKFDLIKTVATVLAEQDWDTESDSGYIDHPIVKDVFNALYGWFKEEEE